MTQSAITEDSFDVLKTHALDPRTGWSLGIFGAVKTGADVLTVVTPRDPEQGPAAVADILAALFRMGLIATTGGGTTFGLRRAA